MCGAGHVLCKLLSQCHWLLVDPHISLFPSVVLRLSCLEDVQIPFLFPTLVKYLLALGSLHRQQREREGGFSKGCDTPGDAPFSPSPPSLLSSSSWLHRDFPKCWNTSPQPSTRRDGVNLGYAAVFSWPWIRIKISQAVRSRNVGSTSCLWPLSGQQQQQELLCLSLGSSLCLMQYFKR